MKKLFLFSLLLSSCALLASCGCGGKGGSDPTPEPTIDPSREKNQKVNFYIDYWHSSEPIYTMMWYTGEPLRKCPQEAVLTDADATDPDVFNHFLGYSLYSSSIDDSKLWNFATDSTISTTLNLYGIWVDNR